MDILASIGRQYPHAMELNVLVLGMPNVGKSTLLNMLRHEGIKGPQAKAFRTSANPGLTQSLSTRLKISEDPVVYAYDSPGIMVPFLGIGEEGAERGVRLALIAGIKEGLYNSEDMAAYLFDRLNIIDPISPLYMPLLPPGSSPTSDVEEFLGGVAKRMGLIKRGEMDLSRAAVYFVGWWRNQGGDGTDQRLPTSKIQSWGFDFQWNLSPEEQNGGRDHASIVQEKMEQIIGDYVIRTDRELVNENNISQTQLKKKTMLEEKERRRAKYAAKRAAR
jgi:ribosome biogenesis GTPase A